MKSADEQEFTAFVRDRGDALLRYARLLEPDPAAAEDILQIALMRVLRHWPRRLDAPEAYARATILNLVRDRARRRRLVPVPAEAGLPSNHPVLPGAGGGDPRLTCPDTAQAQLDAPASVRAGLFAPFGRHEPPRRPSAAPCWSRLLRGQRAVATGSWPSLSSQP